MIDVLKGLLERPKLGEVQAYRNVTVFPVFSSQTGRFDYITLSEALEAHLLTVAEVSQGGSVPELKVVNAGEKPILLLDGEEVAGAKQNRVLNTSVLVAGKDSVVIPVSCTEQGRWNYTSDVFHDSGTVMSREVRARKVRSVSCSLDATACYHSDQGEVWNGIAELQESSGVHSPTMAMRDVYESKKDDVEEACKAFPLIDGQCGLLAMIEGKVAGMDLVSSPKAYAHLHPKLVKSYSLEAALGKQPKGKGVTSGTKEQALAFLATLPQCEEKKFKSVGLGDDYRYKAHHVAGTALIHDNCVVHTAFFSVEEAVSTAKMSDLRRRRAYRIVE